MAVPCLLPFAHLPAQMHPYIGKILIFPFQTNVKKAATILLICILAFNWLGYRLLSGYMEHRSDLALEKRIDREAYDESSLLEIRVSLNAPYITNTSAEFERIDGEIEVNGVHYKYVKRKVENGELVLMCIPHEDKTKILNSRVDFLKMVNDVDQAPDGKSKQSVSFKPFSPEYRQENNSWKLQSIYLVLAETTISSETNVADGYYTIPKQPPRA